MNKIEYYGKIYYAVDEDHPDWKYMKGQKSWDYDDVYRFNPDYWDEDKDEDEMIARIKNDLLLVAGGGYDHDHIHNVRFNIYRI